MSERNYKMRTVYRHWLNLETFILCLDDVVCIKKLNLWRDVDGINSLLPALEIHFNVEGYEPVAIDYLKEDHRDQVFDAIWGEIKKMG